jgi:hypothetical protein
MRLVNNGLEWVFNKAVSTTWHNTPGIFMEALREISQYFLQVGLFRGRDLNHDQGIYRLLSRCADHLTVTFVPFWFHRGGFYVEFPLLIVFWNYIRDTCVLSSWIHNIFVSFFLSNVHVIFISVHNKTPRHENICMSGSTAPRFLNGTRLRTLLTFVHRPFYPIELSLASAGCQVVWASGLVRRM